MQKYADLFIFTAPKGITAWIRYVVTAAVFAVFVALIAWMRGAFTAADKVELYFCLCDSFCVPGILGIGFGFLLLASNGGAFDMLSYAFKSLFRLFKKDVVDRKYGGYYEYTQERRAKKRSFWYLVIVGAAYLLVGIVFLIAYYQVLPPQPAN